MRSSIFRKRELSVALVVLIPFLIYVVHALFFRSWIIDDAGISFAYARNLAQGYGLVAQPGRAPVEGYSNFTWVVLLAPFFWLRLFDPIVTPKLISAGLVLVSFVLLYRALAAAWPRPKPLALLALALLALNPSFVIWTTSGLENALYVCLICALFYAAIRSLDCPPEKMRRGALLLGGLAALIGMTRPDGVLFAVVFPAVLALNTLWDRARPWRAAARLAAGYLLAGGLLYGAFLAFRLAYFGALLPNTYFAKGGPSPRTLLALLLLRADVLIKFYDLVISLGGKTVLLVLAGAFVATVYLMATRQFRKPQAVLLMFLAASAAVYMLLPDDWMGEFRFGTPFFVFAYLYALTVAAAVLGGLAAPFRWKALAALLAAVMAVSVSAVRFWPRTVKFAADPTVPFTYVTDTYALKFNDAAARLGLAQASLLLPDVGGALYYSQLTVYDLGGLTDKTIAQTMGRDQPAFYDYVFETLKPTFIHTHGAWDLTADLEQDPRLRRDYIALHEYPDDYVQQTSGLLRHSGEYVRREAVRSRAPAVYALRVENGQTDLSYAALLTDLGYSLPAAPSAAEQNGLTPLNLDVGGVARVLAYQLSSRATEPGGRLTLTLYWSPEAATAEPDTVFVSLDEPGAGGLAESDSQPLNGAYPTSVWIPGQAFLDTYVLQVPEGAPATGAATVSFGLYDGQTRERLPVTDPLTGSVSPDSAAVVGRVEIRP